MKAIANSPELAKPCASIIISAPDHPHSDEEDSAMITRDMCLTDE